MNGFEAPLETISKTCKCTAEECAEPPIVRNAPDAGRTSANPLVWAKRSGHDCGAVSGMSALAPPGCTPTVRWAPGTPAAEDGFAGIPYAFSSSKRSSAQRCCISRRAATTRSAQSDAQKDAVFCTPSCISAVTSSLIPSMSLLTSRARSSAVRRGVRTAAGPACEARRGAGTTIVFSEHCQGQENCTV